MEKMLTIAEAAERLRLSTNTLAWFRHQGTGPNWGKLGKRVFYRESDIDAYLDAAFAKNA